MEEEDEREPCPEVSEASWRVRLEQDSQLLEATRLGEELTRRLLRRLAEAWRDLNYRHLRSRLRPPTIALHESERRWGAWDPARRLITLSRRQVLCYTWESAIETLKHEMAHQVVSELWGRGGEEPHGAAFREACGLLAADPAATGDGGVPLGQPGGLGAGSSGEDVRLLRIQKLLALADNNPDEHEARAAFARASELMLKYNLDTPSLAGQAYAYRTLGRSSGRVAHHHYLIASILQEFFFVQCIWVDSFVVERGVRGHLLEVMGKRANVEMAEYVYECLIRQTEALWQAFKRERGIRERTAKREYLDGLLSGFRRQLRRTAAQSEERGLVWVGDPALDEYVGRRHPRITRSRLGSVAGSDVREQGVRAGERLRLHRPIAPAGGRGRGLALPGPGAG